MDNRKFPVHPKLSKHKTVQLNALMSPPKSKGLGCLHCHFFQFTSKAEASPSAMKKWTGRRVDSNHYCRWNVRGRGNSENPLVLFVGEAPGRDEDRAGIALIGRSGQLMDRVLTKVGIHIDDYYMTNVIRCCLPEGKKPTVAQMVPCTGYLSREIRKLDPKIIVPLGATALMAVSGEKGLKITAVAGRPFVREVMGKDRVIFPIHHPAYILRNDYEYPQWVQIFEKLAEEIENVRSGKRKVEKAKMPAAVVLDDPLAAEYVLWELLRARKRCAVDIETRGGKSPFVKGVSKIAMVSITNNPRIGYTVPVFHKDVNWTKPERRRIRRLLKQILVHKRIPKFGQNFKFDMLWLLAHWGVEVTPFEQDTMLTDVAAITEQKGVHGLDALSFRFDEDMAGYKRQVEATEKEYAYDFTVMPLYGKEGAGTYSALDSVATYRIADKMEETIQQREMEGKTHPLTRWLAFNYMPRLSRTLMRLEYNGAKIDAEMTGVLCAAYEARRQKALEEIRTNKYIRRFERDVHANGFGKKPKREWAEFQFNPGSYNQLAHVLFTMMGYTPTVFTKTGNPATNKEALYYLAHKEQEPLAMKIVDSRIFKQVVNTWLLPTLERSTASGGYIHGNFNMHTVVSGRLSSSDPNLMNIPNRAGGDVKRMYVSRFGDEGLLLAVDYAQIEYRFLAAIAKVSAAIRAFKTGGDPHKDMALQVYGLRQKPGDPDYDALDKITQKLIRTIAKRVNFGVIYGAGADAVMRVLASEWPPIYLKEEEARKYVSLFHHINPEVKPWAEKIMREIFTSGRIYSLFGRQRNLLEARSGDSEIAARAGRQGPNHVIQSTAAEITLTSLIALTELFEKHNLRSRLILTVHDSIAIDVYYKEFATVVQLVREVMENVPTVSRELQIWPKEFDWWFWNVVPIEIDIEVGPNWRDMVSLPKNIASWKDLTTLDCVEVENSKGKKKNRTVWDAGRILQKRNDAATLQHI